MPTTGPRPAVRPVIDLHKSFGITVLGLVLLRILWRYRAQAAALAATLSRLRTPGRPSRPSPALRRNAAAAAHRLYPRFRLEARRDHPIQLYGLVPFPRIGFVESLPTASKEEVHTIFGAAHVWLGYALYALFALHIAGVLKHHAIDRESELSRMLPGGAGQDGA